MPVLSTGLVPVAGYANKIRKIVFAQNRELVKESNEWSKAIAHGAAVLNVALYRLLVEELKLKKAVLIEPVPIIINRMRIDTSTTSIEQKLIEIAASARQIGVEVPREQAVKTAGALKASVVT